MKRSAKDHVALALSAEVRLRRNEVREAFVFYTLAVNAAPDVRLYKERFLELAGLGLPLAHSDSLANAFAACLKTPDLASRLENWAGLLLVEPRFHAAYGLANRQAFDPSNKVFFSGLTDFRPLLTPLFLEGIKSNVVCDPVFEEFITHIRRHLLDDLEAHARLPAQDYVALASALSHYAFFTDFILDITQDEQKRIDALRHGVETQSDTARNGAAIAILACYQPLYGLANAKEVLANLKTKPLADVVKVQIGDYFALCEVAASMPSLTDIDEGLSAKVREQYESFPFPRWRALSKQSLLKDWQNDAGSRRVESPLLGKHAKILIAGCGTGREATMLSTILSDAMITAVDLSRTSLAYAAIKAREHGLENISFWHADILKLGATGRTFDYISSGGVLHHMQNPVEGWKLLCGLLKPGGLMSIGLYSELGRKAVVEAHEAIRKSNYPPSPEGMLRFRRESPQVLPRQTLLKLAKFKDYYSTNMYRDFLFPVQEHRFDALQIKDILKQLGLSFEGFNIAPAVLANYRAMFPDDPNGTGLDNWHRFEQNHPDTFRHMYNFWCRKPGG